MNILRPEWWNSEHSTFRVDFERIKKRTNVLLVNDTPATIIITLHHAGIDEWSVEYSKVMPERNNPVHHTVYMTRQQLETAFDVTDNAVSEPKWAERFNLDAGVEGCFARVGNFLNIPNPNISQRKDLSISVHITPAIRRAIRHLLTESV